jgi:hypothetical protein
MTSWAKLASSFPADGRRGSLYIFDSQYQKTKKKEKQRWLQRPRPTMAVASTPNPTALHASPLHAFPELAVATHFANPTTLIVCAPSCNSNPIATVVKDATVDHVHFCNCDRCMDEIMALFVAVVELQ